MQIFEAAHRSLQELGKPTHLRDLVSYIEDHGYFAFEATSRERDLGVAIDRRSKGPFYRHSPATYGLLKWLNVDLLKDLALEEEIDAIATEEQPAMPVLALPIGVGQFDFDSVTRAPESPGVYAWYSKLDAGLADYVQALAGDGRTDLGDKNLREFLLRHSHKFDPLPYTATAKGSFETTWSGKLEPQLAASLERILNDEDLDGLDDEGKETATRVRTPFKKQQTRHLLVEAIKKATPFLASPIYIGTSDNLRRRLNRHTAQIIQLREYLASEPGKREEILLATREMKRRTNFAGRITALELSPAQLEVYTLDVEQLSNRNAVSNDELKSLAACVEWLLNRWHRPLAGRI